MKTRLTIIMLLISSLCASAQSDGFRKQFESFKQESSSKYAGFRKQCNDTYAEFLKKAWESYTSKTVERPKEEPLPPVNFDNGAIGNDKVTIKNIVKTVPTMPRPKPVEPVKTIQQPDAKKFTFNFYGETLSISADSDRLFNLASISESDVADAWLEISKSGYDAALGDCLAVRDSHNYCDWAYLQMVYSFSRRFTGDENKASILTTWLLCQSGYKARLARDEKQLCFLFGSDYTIFGARYFTIGGQQFYCMNCDASQISIADECSFPGEKGVSFDMRSKAGFGNEFTDARSLKSKKYENAAVVSSVSTNLVKFLASYPDTQYGDNYMTRWSMYADTPLDKYSQEKIYPPLKAAIAGKSKQEGANILLNFVQTAFKYEYDDKVWGHDRIFFAEETLYYDSCDCEDRSILYSRLVRDLLGLDVALVYYPNHLATAVRFDEDVKGDHFILDEKKFTVCDPTYIGAPVGATMPAMKDKEATLILLRQ